VVAVDRLPTGAIVAEYDLNWRQRHAREHQPGEHLDLLDAGREWLVWPSVAQG
jgi:hypothetical protein